MQITSTATDRHYGYVVVHGTRTGGIGHGMRVSLSYLNTVSGALQAVRDLHPDVAVERVTEYIGPA